MTAPLRLLMVNYEFPPIGGGGANAHLNLLREFKAMPLHIDVLTSGLGPRDTVETLAPNITLHRLAIRKKDLHYWRKLEVLHWLRRAVPYYGRLVRTRRPHLVHAFFAFPSGLLPWTTRRGLPYLLSLRGSDVPGFNPRLGLDYRLLAPLFRSIWHNAAAVVANSSGLAQLARRFAPGLDVPVIPNGIDTDRFAPRPDEPPHSPLRLLTVARLVRRKRLDILIRAVALLRDRGLAARLDIAGDGNLAPELTALIESLSLAGCVRLLGRREPAYMPALYRENDLFLMASLHEGMSNAMLEALAAGLPVLTTPCEGADELVTSSGRLLDPTPAAFADAAADLARNPQQYTRLSAAARQTAQTYTWSRAAQQYFDIYRDILARGTSHA